MPLLLVTNPTSEDCLAVAFVVLGALALVILIIGASLFRSRPDLTGDVPKDDDP